jgi:hypothetical protein
MANKIKLSSLKEDEIITDNGYSLPCGCIFHDKRVVRKKRSYKLIKGCYVSKCIKHYKGKIEYL